MINTFWKKIINFMLKNNKNREEVAWFFTPQEDQIKTTVCLVLYKRAVHTTVCVTRKMAGVGHLALYWARSSLRAAQSGWCRDCPGTQHSCDPAWNPGRAGNCLQRTLGPLWLDLFFQHKIYIFFLFFKNIFNKKCQKC